MEPRPGDFVRVRTRRWLVEGERSVGGKLTSRVGMDLGAFQLVGDHLSVDGIAGVCAPRRTVLDKILVDAATEAGTEVREGFSVTGLTWSDGRVTGIRGHDRGGTEIEELARIVIGADGRNSMVARAVQAVEYNTRPALTSTQASSSAAS